MSFGPMCHDTTSGRAILGIVSFGLEGHAASVTVNDVWRPWFAVVTGRAGRVTEAPSVSGKVFFLGYQAATI